ncbi:MAG: putative DNA-binding transcriptional regulator YafY [Saprospiraceae bacterium]|jgi:predicted DNA-binding transcriptional regulator YafY
MPVNLNAWVRITTIDQCLKNIDKTWTWETLANACEEELGKIPSRKTIMNDIQIMRNGRLGFYAPIEWNAKRKSYEYIDTKFSIFYAKLKESELQELRNAVTILNQFKGFRQFENIEEIVLKLEQSINSKTRKEKSVIQFDTNPDAMGLKWLDLTYRKIGSKETIRIEYKPFNFDDSYWVLASPYLLKEYNNRWFLFAYDHKAKRIFNFALDRIEAIQDSIQDFHFIEDFDPDLYFKNIIGVTIPEGTKIQKVVIESKPDQAKYIKTKPIHYSQEIVEEKEGAVIFSFNLILNYELESLLLSFGEKIKVLKPLKLKKLLKRRIILASENYL